MTYLPSEHKNMEVVNLQRPFPGLQSFQEKNKSQFGGRDLEISELFDMTEGSVLTVVFGKSGIGKTSLLLAGLMPELQKNFYLPVYIRIDYSSLKSPLEQLKAITFEKLKSQDDAVPEFEQRTLWEYFHDVRLLDGMMTPVLILDQFEEIFTLGKDKYAGVLELMTQLSDLIENRVPLVVQENSQRRTDILSSNYSEQHYRVILSLREDYLAQLEGFKKYIPSLKNNRYRVVQMTVLQAMDAAVKPGKGLLDREVAAEIIRKLPGVTEPDFDETAEEQDGVKRLLVEPFLLSLICYQMNEKRIQIGEDKFTIELVRQFQISDVINSYYDDTMKEFNDKVRLGIEDELLTESGYRKLETLETMQSKYGIGENVMKTLIDKRIVRKEERDGVEYVELIHDVLAPVIKHKRDLRIVEINEKERSAAIKRAIELDRTQRRKYIYMLFLILFTFLFIGIGFYANEKANEATRLKNLEFAQKLLLITNNVSSKYGELEAATLFSRTAYLMYKENRGENFNTFYMDMYKRLDDLGVDFKFSFYDSDQVQIRSIVNLNGFVYSGYTDGKVIRTKWSDSLLSPNRVLDLGKKVTGIDVSNDKKYMAIGGAFLYVALVDLEKNPIDTIQLTSPYISINSKSLCFTEDNTLLLRTDSAITGWKLPPAQGQVVWKQKKLVMLKNNVFTPIDNNILSVVNAFSLQHTKFNCMTVCKDKIALGIDSGIVLILPDSVVMVNYPDLRSTTSIQFDHEGHYLYIGNDEGAVCRMSVKNYKIEKNQNQIARIPSIVCSSNGKYVATGSLDGNVGIYKTDAVEEWKDLIPLVLALPGCQHQGRNVFSVAFSEDNQFILAGYNDGAIYKWPVSSETLSSLICDTRTRSKKSINMDSIWSKFVDRKLTRKEQNLYHCKSSK